MHQQGSQVRITSFADTELAYLSARARLTRDQANPGRKLLASLKVCGEPMFATIAAAVNRPTPGISAKVLPATLLLRQSPLDRPNVGVAA
jgi:hypothetical protein